MEIKGNSFAAMLINDKEFDEYELPEEITSRFFAIENLTASDYGETFLLEEKDSGKRYVLKSYKKSSRSGDILEAELLRTFEHKGLPKYEEGTETEDAFFTLREHIEGVTLEQYFHNHKPSEGKTVGIIIEVCEILSFLHSQQAPIIHRDIKPSNIIIDVSGGSSNASGGSPNASGGSPVKLIDFGISRRYSEDAPTDTVCFGTQKFAPPEQYGFSQTDSRADLYALGVVLRYLLTGSPEPTVQISNKALERIVAKATAFAPEQRYQSAAAFKKALQNYNKRVKPEALISMLAAVFVISAGVFFALKHTDISTYEPPEILPTPETSSTLEISTASETSSTPETSSASETSPVQEIPDGVYVFKEPLIEKAARYVLQKNEDEWIFPDELKTVTGIYIIGEEVAASRDEYWNIYGQYRDGITPYGFTQSLEDLNAMENLIDLHIMANTIADISPIAENKQLRVVDFERCEYITDFSPLLNLPLLRDIKITHTDVDDYTIFKEISTLYGLRIQYTTLGSIAELGFQPNIEILVLHGSRRIENLNGIENFPSLKELNIDNTSITDFSQLDNLPYLKHLQISADMRQYLHTLNRDDVEVYTPQMP
ncbi:MAG: serine/threonine protein kinase [Oscillospiraceae bacterium]|nr:serine/threonine protein kinase [Oscillospiraceae bacterium]